MSKIFAITVNAKNGKATIAQNAWVHYCTLDRLVALVNEANGKIVKGKDGFIKATVSDEKIAKTIVRKVERELAQARKSKQTEVKITKNAKATSRATQNAPTSAKGKAKADIITIDGKEYTLKGTANGDGFVLVPVAPAPVKASPRKPSRTKGNAFDFTKIKGKTNADKNKALHAVLVGMGMKDSRTKEYLAIWNARPWAK